MHRCLEIYEIVTMIASLLPRTAASVHSPLAGYQRADPDLLSLALTSKFFLDPALDELWFRMDSLLPIAKILLGFADLSPIQWNTAMWRETFKTNRPIVTELDLRRFEYYASRIRRLELDFVHHPESVLQTFFRTLFAFQAPFPSLQHLKWLHSGDKSGHHRFLPFFGGPALETLVIAVFDLPQSHLASVNSAVTLLGARSPSLRTLEVSPSAHAIYLPSYHQQASYFVLNTQSLHRVKTCYQLSSHALLHLSRMSSVHTLQLSIGEETAVPDTLHFPALLELNVIATRSVDCARFLQAVRSPVLQKFGFYYFGCVSNTIMRILCVALMQGSSTAGFQKLSILPCDALRWKTYKCDCGHDEGSVDACDSLSVFFPCRNITDMLLWHCSIHLDGSIVEDAAKAWPRLRRLYVPPSTPPLPGHFPKPTMRAIYAIVKRCPLIRYINLDIRPPASQQEVRQLRLDCSREPPLAQERSRIDGDVRGECLVTFERALGDESRDPLLKTLKDAGVHILLMKIFSTFTPTSTPLIRFEQSTTSDAEVMFHIGWDTEWDSKAL